MDYTVTVRHGGDLDFTATNSRTEADISWGPEEGRWMATELFLSGLGSCMLATLVDYARANGIDVDGASVRVGADSTTRPVRMSTVHVVYTFPPGLTGKQVDALVRAGNRCKVHNTVEHPPTFAVEVAAAAS